MLYESEASCLKESEIYGFYVMLGLKETMDRLAMTDSVRWYGHVLRREDGHVLRRALDFEVEGQRKKGRPKMTWKRQVEEENMKVGLRRKDALCRSMWSVGINKVAAGNPHLLG